ncbi:glycosyl transferase family 2 [Stackebrandtia albiflava]|uniref:Glycosyl transferase family 2 n=1 Tax=Stackebrandtia albiflava TaxID=406432 RepID=A0A562V3X4_9ACTN|nr:glycosyltransferase family 2 protein [Stackebrandtia albiflava]TWJ12580.1 glycosyl transferase family 2 [Stackebrandtia albiflava]
MTDWPSIGVVIPTHDRPDLMRAALDSVLAQRYPGRMSVIVVFDRAKPDTSLECDGDRPVRVSKNRRTPGLAGARNTGIDAVDTDLVAFCDDDDVWLPGKLTAQVAAMEPGTEMTTCAISVAYRGRTTPRLAGKTRVRQSDLLRSRMMMLHSSTFLLRRDALLGGLGMVAEDAPGSQNEDWDLLLRAARRRPIVHVDSPYAKIHWGGSHFETRYDTKISSLRWMLDRHPELHGSPVGAARVYGQLSCWHAAVGDRRAALRWAGRATRSQWKEPRAVIGAAAALGLVRVPTVLSLLHRRGRGL